MALDYSKLSDEELQAIADNDYSKLSDATLTAIASEPETKQPSQVSQPSERSGLEAVAEIASVPLTAAAYGPMSPDLKNALKAGVGPYVSGVGEGVKSTVDLYKTRPLLSSAVEALGVATLGVPPIAAGQQALSAMDKYRAIKEGATSFGQSLSQGAPTTTSVTGKATFETVKPFGEMRSAAGANSELGLKLKSLYESSGGNNAVRSFLNSAEGQAAQATDPKFAARAQAYLEKVPSYGAQAMKVVSPILQGAARVAGPVGNAMLAYDMANQFAENKQRIEANPSAQGLQYNPYAQQLRGEAPSVAAAGAMNRRSAIGGQQYGGLTQQEQSILEKDRLNMQMRVQAAKRVLGQ
jgi:hypothetical protein